MKSVCHFPLVNRLCLFFVLSIVAVSFSFIFASHKVVCFLFSLCICLPITGVCFFFPSPPPPSAYISGVHTSPAYTLHICRNCKPCSVCRGSGKHPAKDGTDKDTWSVNGHGLASASWDSSTLGSILETSAEERQMVSGGNVLTWIFEHTCALLWLFIQSFIHYHMWQSRIELEYCSVAYFECITECAKLLLGAGLIHTRYSCLHSAYT